MNVCSDITILILNPVKNGCCFIWRVIPAFHTNFWNAIEISGKSERYFILYYNFTRLSLVVSISVNRLVVFNFGSQKTYLNQFVTHVITANYIIVYMFLYRVSQIEQF